MSDRCQCRLDPVRTSRCRTPDLVPKCPGLTSLLGFCVFVLYTVYMFSAKTEEMENVSINLSETVQLISAGGELSDTVPVGPDRCPSHHCSTADRRGRQAGWSIRWRNASCNPRTCLRSF